MANVFPPTLAPAVPATTPAKVLENLSANEKAILDAAHKAGVSPKATATTMAALAKSASQATQPVKPVPGKFFLSGFNQVLPVETQFGFNLLLGELSAIPPKHFAANERQSLNTALESLVRDVAKFGVTVATSADCRKLIAAIRHQAKAVAARAHQADIKTDSVIRLQEAERKARADKRAAARETEYKGEGTPKELAAVNALPVSVKPVYEAPRLGRKARLEAKKKARNAALEADRPWE